MYRMVGAKQGKNHPKAQARTGPESSRRPGGLHLQSQQRLVERPCEEGVQKVLMDQSQAQDAPAEPEPGTQMVQRNVSLWGLMLLNIFSLFSTYFFFASSHFPLAPYRTFPLMTGGEGQAHILFLVMFYHNQCFFFFCLKCTNGTFPGTLTLFSELGHERVQSTMKRHSGT